MKNINCQNTHIVPSKIICVGRNYAEHIEELGNETPSQPVIFLKPNSAIATELYTNEQEEIHYEAEICFSIKDNNIYAVGIGFDLTKRQLQSALKDKGLPWERAKAFDDSAVFSEFIPLVHPVESLQMKLLIQDQLQQHADYDLMIRKPESLLREVQQFMTTVDGDILMTGTPKGVGKLQKGYQYSLALYSNGDLLISQNWLAH